MGKNIDELGSYQDFRAPWETETGDEAEVDKGKLKKLLYNARSAKAAALDERDDARAELETATADLEEAKKEAASANGEEATKKIAKLEKELADAKAKVDTLEKDKERSDLRAEVLAGLDPKYAKYVQGETRDELEKSLEEVKADFGLEDGDGEGGEDGDEPKVRTRPRTTLRNPLDPNSGKGGDAPVDFDKVADDILGNGVFR